MSFPTLTPNARTMTLGDYPVKSVRSLSGKETRIRYGDTRSQSTCDLSYQRLKPEEVKQFVDHYDQMGGTSNTFYVGQATLVGYGLGGIKGAGSEWRYAEPPSIQTSAGNCDRSDVSVKLVSVA